MKEWTIERHRYAGYKVGYCEARIVENPFGGPDSVENGPMEFVVCTTLYKQCAELIFDALTCIADAESWRSYILSSESSELIDIIKNKEAQ